jgi:hypothetical protein
MQSGLSTAVSGMATTARQGGGARSQTKLTGFQLFNLAVDRTPLWRPEDITLQPEPIGAKLLSFGTFSFLPHLRGDLSFVCPVQLERIPGGAGLVPDSARSQKPRPPPGDQVTSFKLSGSFDCSNGFDRDILV